MLDLSARDKLIDLSERMESYSNNLKQIETTNELKSTLKIISGIWSMSLEVEIGYMDIQERYRTLEMYGIDGDQEMVILGRKLPSEWETLYVRSKEIYFQLEKLKEKQSKVESKKIERFCVHLEALNADFKSNGPSF